MWKIRLVQLWFLCVFTLPSSGQDVPRRPHIIFILADDLGFNDVGYRGGDQIPTPNLDALAYSGVILDNYYVQPLCTPSRSALLTGRYPIRNGMQGLAFLPDDPVGLPEDERTLAEHLQELGYDTQMVGKWHLGYCRVDTASSPAQPLNFLGWDMRNGMDKVEDSQGTYATRLFTDKAVEIIANHDEQPLFLYLAHLAAHGPMVNATLAPPEVAARFSYIEDDFRRDTVANIVLLDQAIGEIVKALDDAGMLENSIIVFSSDNGGNTGPMVFAGTGDSSNYPLKGTKASLFEGGTRVPGFIFSPLISARSRLSSKLTHMVDWFPTLYAAAGGNVSEILSQTELDSFDQWKWLAEGEGPVGDYGIREEMLYNIDENIPTAAIRIGKWKYITGPQMMNNVIWNVSLNGWFGDSGRLNLTTQEDLDAYNDVLEWTSQMNLAGQILSRKGWLPSGEIMEELRAAAEVQCNDDDGNGGLCDPGVAPCLFDIEADPCEKNNLLASDHELCDPESGLDCEKVAEMLRNRIGYFTENVMIPSVLDGTERDPKANPDSHGGFWTNWMDYDQSRNQN
ncbi:unnamed protein product [Cyprideis torosa]|uniref:Uncharacterized protein n=1 Tax=Cyprideis torosa TaxID=163714 RepID=A0A7R8ZMA3_9CRUS|nr:unnamed protein product [Cyprideis torosa]CAG0893734.1 unnamed protein product [Cyprideis torosa]